MSLRGVVESYVNAAMKHAVPEKLPDGTIGATVPECFGVVAFGADLRECGDSLAANLEDWVRVGLQKGFTLPVIDGIDLNGLTRNEAMAVAEELSPRSTSPAGLFITDEQELEAALDRWDQEDKG